MTSDGGDDDENFKTTLALFAFWRIFFAKNSCGRVGKISKSASLTPANAPFWYFDVDELLSVEGD